MFNSTIDKTKLDAINEQVKAREHVDREHVKAVLEAIPTNEAKVIVEEIKHWLEELHNSKDFPKVVFPKGHIDAIIGDLESYGRVQPDTIYREYAQKSNQEVPQS
jgi:predicted Rossmann fold nucleotide-binding protein DprA/Smf involved in DNA uptake